MTDLLFHRYLAEDIFDKTIIRMRLSGKQRMHYKVFEIGEEVYISLSPYTKDHGRWTTSTNFKMDNELFGKKLELDKKQKEIE